MKSIASIFVSLICGILAIAIGLIVAVCLAAKE